MSHDHGQTLGQQVGWEEATITIDRRTNRSTSFCKITTTNGKVLYGYLDEGRNHIGLPIKYPYAHGLHDSFPWNTIPSLKGNIADYNQKQFSDTRSAVRMYEELETEFSSLSKAPQLPKVIMSTAQVGQEWELSLHVPGSKRDLLDLTRYIGENLNWKIEPATPLQLQSL